MELNVPSFLKSMLHNAQIFQKPYPVLPNSTLNQKLNVQSSQSLDEGEYPFFNIAVIGNGGLKVETDSNNQNFTRMYVHKPTDTGLFRELPWIVRPVTSDLTDANRARYRLRKLITVDNTNYFAYYGKVIDFSTTGIDVNQVTVLSDGTTSSVSFSPSNGDLNPTPTVLSSDESVTTSGKYISTVSRFELEITASDVTEIINASQLLYGTSDQAVISEIGFCSGVDKEVTSNQGGIEVIYTESIATQIMSFLSTNFPATTFNQGMKQVIDFGNLEPLREVT